MASIPSILNPATYNALQRAGTFASIVALLLVIVFHNPIHGYQTEIWPSCVDVPAYLCQIAKPHELGLLEWKSNGAMIEELQSLGSMLLTITAIFIALFAWLSLFKKNKIDCESRASGEP